MVYDVNDVNNAPIVEEEEDETELEFDRQPKEEPKVKEKVVENPYEEIIDGNPELKQYMEYRRVRMKAEKGLKLTPQETDFKFAIEEAIRKEQEAIKQQEEQAKLETERQEKLKAEIQAEYKRTKATTPEKIVSVREKDITLTGGESIPKILKFVFAMKKARKKGGKVLIQVFRSRKVLVKWTANDITFVEFYTTDEKGNELMEITRFSEYPYSFEGTPIPVLFAVQGYAEGWDFFSEFRKDLSSEMVSRLITRAFHAGYLKGAEVAQPNKKKGMFDGLVPFMPLILIGGFIVIGYLMYMVYQDNTKILETLQAIQNSQAAQQVVADASALVVR